VCMACPSAVWLGAGRWCRWCCCCSDLSTQGVTRRGLLV
jgi:hypothetical protein